LAISSVSLRNHVTGRCVVHSFSAQYTNPSAVQGYLVGQDGSRFAAHDGLWHYTIGQGARLAGLSEKWFVARKGVGKTGQDILVVPGR
jgi:tRNA U34 2-thiouridine synthase MnmA/TrmU